MAGTSVPQSDAATHGPDPYRAASCIVVVDDSPSALNVLMRMLARDGYRNVHATTDPRELRRLCTAVEPDLILLDMHMPYLSGLEAMRSIQDMREGSGYLPVLMVTGDADPVMRHTALRSGASDFVTKPFDAHELRARIQNLLHARALHVQLRQEKALLEERVRVRTFDLTVARLEVLNRLALVAEFRDDATGLHTRRVGKLAAAIARQLGASADLTEAIRYAAPLHDLGKIAIPDAILLKPGPLDDGEMRTMRQHAPLGAQMLSGGRSPLLKVAREIALTHHERWDGSGYPGGLRATAIPFAGRIVAAADYYDALRHDRPYRAGLPVEQVLDMVHAGAGSHFDPDVAEALLIVVNSALSLRLDAGVVFQRPNAIGFRRAGDSAGSVDQ